MAVDEATPNDQKDHFAAVASTKTKHSLRDRLHRLVRRCLRLDTVAACKEIAVIRVNRQPQE
jgi:hypothetical protein